MVSIILVVKLKPFPDSDSQIWGFPNATYSAYLFIFLFFVLFVEIKYLWVIQLRMSPHWSQVIKYYFTL